MKLIWIILLIASLSGCAINTPVKPIPVGAKVTQLCIVHNPDIFMDEFEPLVQRIVQEHGIDGPVVTPPIPDGCRFRMEYAANWRWDMAMYLQFAEFRVYDGPNRMADAQYDARLGGANLGKFGATENKVRPVLDRLLANVGRSRAPAPAAK